MAGSLEKIAGIKPGEGADQVPDDGVAGTAPSQGVVEVPPMIPSSRIPKERIHA